MKLHFKASPVHRIVPDFIVQMGDITVGDGSGGLYYCVMMMRCLQHYSMLWVYL